MNAREILVLGSGTNYAFFNTKDATGAPVTLAGTPSLYVRKNANAAEATAGLTLTVDFDSKTGQHLVAMDVDNGTLAFANNDVADIFVIGTSGGISVSGTLVWSARIVTDTLTAGQSTAVQASAFAALAACAITAQGVTKIGNVTLVPAGVGGQLFGA